MMLKQQINEIIRNFRDVNVLVVGDLMLDEYWHSIVERISPEAPVPVARVTNITQTLGGAANTANNIKALNAKATLIGCIGNDATGSSLKRIVLKQGINLKPVVWKKPTIKKLRIISDSQQLLRLDFEDVTPCKNCEKELLINYRQELQSSNVVVISDYAKGTLTSNATKTIIKQALKQKKPVIIDPKPQHTSWYRHCSLLKPNLKEALAMAQILGKRFSDVNEDKNIEAVARFIKKTLKSPVLVTRSEKGASFIGKKIIHEPVKVKKVLDISGAGDTFTAVIALTIALKLPIKQALKLANTACGVVIAKPRTATLTPKELEEALNHNNISSNISL